MLARASAREREIAIRLAIGASRGRLIRSCAESLLLSSDRRGTGFAPGSRLRFLVSFLSTQGTHCLSIWTLKARAGFHRRRGDCDLIVFGLTRHEGYSIAPAAVLKDGARNDDGTGRFQFAPGAVALQVALSLVLLVSALLFSRSLGNPAEDTGFKPKAFSSQT